MSKRSRFQAPPVLRTFDDVHRALREVQDSLDAATRSRATLAIATSDFPLVASGYHRAATRASQTLAAKLPKAAPGNIGERVTLALEDMQGTVQVWAAPGDLVNGATSASFTVDGVVELVSNGINAWTSVAQLPVGGAGTPTWAQVLTSGNVSGASNPTISTGQRLIVAGGQSAGDGDINSATDITIHAATDVHIHAAESIHVGHGGDTDDVHVEAGTIELLSDVNGISLSSATSLSAVATTSATLQAGTFVALVAGTDFSVTTNSVTRLTIEADGSWNVGGSNGTAGQYLRSGGASAAPAWASLAYSELPSIASDTVLGNISGSAGTPTAVSLSNLDSTSIIYDAVTHTFQRSALSGAISSSQNSGATRFSGIRANGTLAASTRTNLNFINSTSVTAAALGDDSVNDEIEIAFQRAALTGAISASANSNATLFDGIRLNGVDAPAARTNLNFLSTTSVLAGGLDDAANDEVELSFQRAALTGAIAASQNSNATLFSGIRANGSATTDRSNINFLSGNAMTVSAADDSGNDEIEVTVAMTGSTSTIDNSTATGALGTIDISSLACGGSYRVSNASSSFSIAGFTAKTTGFWFFFSAEDIDLANYCLLFHENVGATAANRLDLPRAADIESPFLRGIFYYTGSRWRFIPGANPMTIGNATTYVEITEISPDINLVCAAGDVTATTGGGNVTLDATGGAGGGDVTISAGTSGLLTMSCGSGASLTCDTFTIDANGIIIPQMVGAPTVSTGQGAIYTANTNPTSIVFVDENNDAWNLQCQGVQGISSLTTVTNSTTALVLTDVATIPANSANAGTTYRLTGHLKFIRGATATAMTLRMGGFVASTERTTTGNISTTTTAGTYTALIEGVLTVLTSGSGGTAMLSIRVIDTIRGGTAANLEATAPATFTFNTTIDNTIELRAQMQTAVSGCSITRNAGFIELVRL